MAFENDIVLVYFEDNPMTFARIEGIIPDAKPGWYHVKLLILQVPLKVVTWILRDSYIDGSEFTMDGKRMRIERVVSPETPPEANGAASSQSPSTDAKTEKSGRIISLTNRKDR
ncbi:MAG: hypothetical protein PVH30_05125 [Desulfobacterales bacterium]|jgi:hypothetical protein